MYLPSQVERMARAVYMANHKGPFSLPGGHSPAIWENLTLEVQAYCRRMVEALLAEKALIDAESSNGAR